MSRLVCSIRIFTSERSLKSPRTLEWPIETNRLQYGVRGPREKRIILNILPESKRHELKFSLKIEFSYLTIVLNWQVPN